MTKFSKLYELRCMLRQMEADVGLADLTQPEKDVLLAAHSLSEKPDGEITSDQIRQHELVSDLTRSTYHRALRTLLSHGLIEKAKGFKSRRYVVRRDLSGG